MRRSALLFIALIFITPSIGHCQSALKLGTVTEIWPEIGLSFRAYCDGIQNLAVQNADITLSENGRQIPDFTIWCPEKYVHAASSVALVLDASASMAGAGNTAAKQVSYAFVDMMDGVIDEATVTHFNDNAATYQAMTTIKPMLRSAIDALGVHGGSALYDALYLSVVEVAFNSQNPMKALIVVTDSRNDSSFRSLFEVLDLAKLHTIPIHMISLGSETDTAEMRMITSETGGSLILGSPNAGQIAGLYQEISMLEVAEEQDCMLLYHRHCADGSEREVIMEMTNICADTASDTLRYTAQFDSSTLKPMHLALEADTVLAGGILSVALRIINPAAETQRAPFSFTLRYDTALLKSPRFTVGPGNLLDKKPVILISIPDGIRVITGSDAAFHEWSEGEGELLRLYFDAYAPAGRGDTIPLTLSVEDAEFIDGCPALRIDDEQTVILADGTSAVHDAVPAAEALQLWPNPGSGRMQLALPGTAGGEASLLVSDALGRTVLHRSEVQLGSTMSIDLTGQPAGLYNILLLRAGALRHVRYLLTR